MPASVQMNTRLSPSLKKAGDSALAEIGLTPSQAVRALWKKAAKRGKDLHEVAQLLCVEKQAAPCTRNNPVEDGWAMMDAAMASLGIDPSTPLPTTDDELLEEYWLERLANDEEAERALA